MLAAVSGIVTVSTSGAISFVAASGLYLGLMLTVILLIVSFISIIRESRGPLKLRAPVVHGSAEYYKKKLIWSLLISAPGLFIALYAALTTQNGGGEAFIVFIPVMLISYVSAAIALVYGALYLFKKVK